LSAGLKEEFFHTLGLEIKKQLPFAVAYRSETAFSTHAAAAAAAAAATKYRRTSQVATAVSYYTQLQSTCRQEASITVTSGTLNMKGFL